MQYYRKFSIQWHLARLCSLQDAKIHSRTDEQTDGHEVSNYF